MYNNGRRASASCASKRYKKGTRLINFHSWAPSYEDPEFTFSLYSDNILNTFSNQLLGLVLGLE